MILRRAVAGLALWLAVISPAFAESLPLWEAGVGISGAYLPHYRGSSEYQGYLFPIPYFVYRGERVHLDRRGARTELLDSEDISLNLSANLGPPARNDAARAGMPDLDPTIEVGPSLNFRLYENPAENRLFSLRLPLRTAIATDLSHWHNVGWIFLPNLAYDLLNIGTDRAWNVGISAGPIFGNRQYHEYYYGVQSQFATPTRPAYDARGGYGGASIGVTLTRRYTNYWIGGFIRYDYLNHAVFENSPLVRSDHALLTGIAVSRILARSEKQVDRNPVTEP